MKAFLLVSLLSTSAWAVSDQAKLPPSFGYQSRPTPAVFADFQRATYDITYDATTKVAFATATIDLITLERGNPIFDVQIEPTSVELDGISTSAPLVNTPSNETLVRVIQLEVAPGPHTLKVTLPLKNMLSFVDQGVHHGMWFGDLEDRSYLERFLPSNFIFDRLPVVYNITFIGAPEQTIYANGKVEQLDQTHFRVSFPAHYNLTCQFFHTMPKSAVVETRFGFRSLDGQNIPAVVYRMADGSDQSAKLEELKAKTLAIVDELQRDYGPFPHPSLTVYVTASPSGGMEFSGATITSEGALGHELFHSYFARGVMPSDGNAGWIDEALARWRDNGYQRIDTLVGTSNMANHGTYNRVTDRLAYTFGERFMALLDGKFAEKGGLKAYLRQLVATKLFDPLNTQDFMTLMNDFYGDRTDPLFGQFVLGQGAQNTVVPLAPVHARTHQFTEAELQRFL